jgi:glutaredoxin
MFFSSFSFAQVVNPQPDNSQINPKQTFNAVDFSQGINEIIIYSKSDCGRCVNVKDALDAAGITYQVYTEDNDKEYSTLDSKIISVLPNKNFGYSVKYPVLEIDGHLYYAIANHMVFVTELIDLISKQ